MHYNIMDGLFVNIIIGRDMVLFIYVV